GQSIFVASGDNGAAGYVVDTALAACVPASTRHVNELGADPNITQVGGTGFYPVYDVSHFDVGYVPESAWDDFNPITDRNGGATGGGVSAIYPKPDYQYGPGVPADGKRDVPDVALIASDQHPGVFLGLVSGGLYGIGCCAGGTSLATPAWAGIAKLIAQL